MSLDFKYFAQREVLPKNLLLYNFVFLTLKNFMKALFLIRGQNYQTLLNIKKYESWKLVLAKSPGFSQ